MSNAISQAALAAIAADYAREEVEEQVDVRSRWVSADEMEARRDRQAVRIRLLRAAGVEVPVVESAAGLVPESAPESLLEPNGPVTSWRGAAQVLGISEDKLARRRARHDPDAVAWWESPADCRAWFAELCRPAPRPARERKEPKPRSTEAGVFDPAALRAELRRR